MHHSLSRRQFLATAATGAGLTIVSPQIAFGYAANERLNVALIGIGGRGRWFVDTMPKMANVVAMCDVNDQRAGDAWAVVPQAKRYQDFRRMLDEMDKQIEGVIIATPDHTHAVAAAAAMRRGKHVYCEKPLTHSIHEARTLRELAAQTKVATQMGNQGTASEAFRRGVSLIQSGAIGEVVEVHGWNDGGGRGQDVVPTEAQPVPPTLAWDLWLGPAAERGYNRQWLNWHAWRDFGTGQLGNWAVHSLNVAFKALRLDALWLPNAARAEARPASVPIQVQAVVSGIHTATFPRWEVVRWEIPARGTLPAVTVHWHNGSAPQAGRAAIEERLGRRLDWGDSGERKWRDHAGVLLLGSKGRLHGNGHNTEITLLPAEQFEDLAEPPRILPRSPGHEMEWLTACKGGPAAMSNLDYGGPLTEFLLLGNIATQVEGPLEFDPVAGTFLNNPAADALLQREYRTGWQL
jgi:predicted dehydrogenase